MDVFLDHFYCGVAAGGLVTQCRNVDSGSVFQEGFEVLDVVDLVIYDENFTRSVFFDLEQASSIQNF